MEINYCTYEWFGVPGPFLLILAHKNLSLFIELIENMVKFESKIDLNTINFIKLNDFEKPYFIEAKKDAKILCKETKEYIATSLDSKYWKIILNNFSQFNQNKSNITYEFDDLIKYNLYDKNCFLIFET